MEFQTLSNDELIRIVINRLSGLDKYKAPKGTKIPETVAQILSRTRLENDLSKLWNDFLYCWEYSEGSRNRFAATVRQSLDSGTKVNNALKRDILKAIFDWQVSHQDTELENHPATAQQSS